MLRRHLVIGECIAIAAVALAAWLGSHEFVGTFGVTGQVKSCGSVWGLPATGDLNAATCTDELRDRVSVVAVLIGLAGEVAIVVIGRHLIWSVSGA